MFLRITKNWASMKNSAPAYYLFVALHFVLAMSLGLSLISGLCSNGKRQLPWPDTDFAVPCSPASLSLAGRRRRRQPSCSQQPSDNQNVAASYSRYSSDQQREESIADQQRKCQEAAGRNEHQILPEFEYSDSAVSGTKLHRDGLDAMLRDAEAGEFKTLYFHSLSRLSRESVITMPMLKRLVYVYKVRIISVTEGVDSDTDNWEVIASIMSLLHERYIKELAENVFRGQEGAVLAGLCVGDYRFGFTSIPIPGSEQTRKGRNAKPRMQYVVDEITAPWVIRVFNWFVKKRRSIRWITRTLNQRGAPKDHRASTCHWHHQQVAGLLSSRKYVGTWAWGEMRNTRDPETGKIRQEMRPDEECEQWTRELPDLRIIDDETFEKAQRILDDNYKKFAEHRRSDGTLTWSSRGSADCPPRHVLSGLIFCDSCGSKFHVGGTGGRYLFCPNYAKGTCTCKTHLRRDRGERMILGEVGARILSNPVWLDAVYLQTVKSWKQLVGRVPAELESTTRALADVDRKISRLLDRIENGVDDSGVKQRLEERREERRTLVKRLDQLERTNENLGPEPTKDWLREQLRELGECLNGDTPAAAIALRDLVGGKVVVTEIRRDGRKRFHLRGRFTIKVCAISNRATGLEAAENGDDETSDDGMSEEVVIEFVDPSPLDDKASRAKEMYDQDLLNREIAAELKCSRAMVTKLLQHWFTSRGLTMPCSHARRFRIEMDRNKQLKHMAIADQAKALWDDGLLMEEIAIILEVNRDLVTKAIAWWHTSHGLAVPDGRTRRKSLKRKSSRPRRRKDDETGSTDETT
jgi:site-specific DNA recombinase